MLPLEGISWESFVNINANFIIAIDNVVGSAGASIIVFTLLTKIVLFPINQPALKTNAVTRLLTPQMNQIQEMYQNDDETKKKLIGALYAKTGINPVGGLLPIFAQLPIFVGLYTAIKKLATVDSHFKEPFLWIPSLAGPTDGGLDWLLTSRVENGFEPSVGWQNAGLYFVLPLVLLTVQLSLAKLTTPNKEPDAATLAFPFIVAISTLVTPQGLGVYWLTNSVLSAAQTQLARSEIDAAYPDLKRVWEASDDKPEPVMKGDKVTLNGRVGVVVYGPDVDDDCRVQYEDDGTESNFVKSFSLRKAGTVMDEAISELQAAVIPAARPKRQPLRKEPQTRAAKRAASRKDKKKQRAR